MGHLFSACWLLNEAAFLFIRREAYPPYTICFSFVIWRLGITKSLHFVFSYYLFSRFWQRGLVLMSTEDVLEQQLAVLVRQLRAQEDEVLLGDRIEVDSGLAAALAAKRTEISTAAVSRAAAATNHPETAFSRFMSGIAGVEDSPGGNGRDSQPRPAAVAPNRAYLFLNDPSKPPPAHDIGASLACLAIQKEKETSAPKRLESERMRAGAFTNEFMHQRNQWQLFLLWAPTL